MVEIARNSLTIFAELFEFISHKCFSLYFRSIMTYVCMCVNFTITMVLLFSRCSTNLLFIQYSLIHVFLLFPCSNYFDFTENYVILLTRSSSLSYYNQFLCQAIIENLQKNSDDMKKD